MRMVTTESRTGSVRFAPFSLGFHVLLVLAFWLLADDPTHFRTDQSKIDATLFSVEYPKLDVRRESEPQPASVESPANPPVTELKPEFTSGSFALSLTPFGTKAREYSSGVRDGSVPVLASRSSQAVHTSAYPTEFTNASAARDAVRSPTIRSQEPAAIVVPTAEMTDQPLDTGGTLSDDSPNPRAGGLPNSGIHRGDGGSSWMAYGNADPQQGRSDGSFRVLMVDLARSIGARSEKDKLDIVFVVDATGSMKDNIRGIRAYMGHFAERLRRDGKDAAFGAVVFTDNVVQKPEARGVSDDYNDVRNWLFHTEYLGGGDLAESGLEALMSAVKDIDYRRRSERHVILVTDGPLHDADYDGQSVHTLDRVLETLQKKKLCVDVVGIDYLPLKQIARYTGGHWYPIPGAGYLEGVTHVVPEKRLSAMGILSQVEQGRFEIAVPQSKAEWVQLSWKILGPMGTIYQETPPTQQATTTNPVLFTVQLPLTSWPADAFPYTLICRLTDSTGAQGVLRGPVWLQ